MRIASIFIALVYMTSAFADEKLIVSCEDISFAEPGQDGTVSWTVAPGLKVDIFFDSNTGLHSAMATLDGDEGKEKKWTVPVEPLSKLQAITFLDETRIMHEVDATKVVGGTKYRVRDGKWGGVGLITIVDSKGSILERFFTMGFTIAKCGK